MGQGREVLLLSRPPPHPPHAAEEPSLCRVMGRPRH